MIYVDEDTSDKNDRGFDAGVTSRYTRDRGPDDGYYGVEGNHPVGRGRCHVVPTCIIRTYVIGR